MIWNITFRLLIASAAFAIGIGEVYALQNNEMLAYLNPCEALGVACVGDPTTPPPVVIDDPPPPPPQSGGGRRLPRIPDFVPVPTSTSTSTSTSTPIPTPASAPEQPLVTYSFQQRSDSYHSSAPLAGSGMATNIFFLLLLFSIGMTMSAYRFLFLKTRRA